jgi:hypothetical protein
MTATRAGGRGMPRLRPGPPVRRAQETTLALTSPAEMARKVHVHAARARAGRIVSAGRLAPSGPAPTCVRCPSVRRRGRCTFRVSPRRPQVPGKFASCARTATNPAPIPLLGVDPLGVSSLLQAPFNAAIAIQIAPGTSTVDSPPPLARLLGPFSPAPRFFSSTAPV